MAVFTYKSDVPSDADERLKEAMRDVKTNIIKLDDFLSDDSDNNPLNIVQIFDRDAGKEDYSRLFKEKDLYLVDKMIDLAKEYKSVEKVGIPMWVNNTPLRTPDYSVVNLLFLTDGKGQMSSREANSNTDEFISLMRSNPSNNKSLLLGFCKELQAKFPNDYRIKELYDKVDNETSDGVELNPMRYFLIENPNKPLIDDLSSLILGNGYRTSSGVSSVNDAFFKSEGKPDISFGVNTKKGIENEIQASRVYVTLILIDLETQRNANRRLTGRNVW